MKVFYISGYANDVYYVLAENEEKAVEHLRERIRKYIFKKNLRDEDVSAENDPKDLGDNIIVEFGISKGVLESELSVFDMTASAYIFAENGMDLWKDWDITTADVIGDENIAKSLEDAILEQEPEQKSS